MTPKHFGKRTGAPMGWFQPGTVEDLVGLRAAETQHAVCGVMRERLKGHRIADVEERTDFAKKRLGKLLGGHVHLSLNDLQRLELVVGPVLLGLEVKRLVVVNVELAERFPDAAALRARVI